MELIQGARRVITHWDVKSTQAPSCVRYIAVVMPDMFDFNMYSGQQVSVLHNPLYVATGSPADLCKDTFLNENVTMFNNALLAYELCIEVDGTRSLKASQACPYDMYSVRISLVHLD